VTAVLRADDLTKQYGPDVSSRALNGVKLSVQEGSVVAVIGPSGSGKSTLLNLLGGLDTPSDGRVLYRSRDIAGFSAKERSRFQLNETGFVFQFFNLIPNLTAFDNAILPAILARGRADKRAVVRGLFEEAGLADKMNLLPGQLSGGEQQRVAIIRAMVNDPAVIFADEPTGNLDSKTGDQIFGLLAFHARTKGRTLGYVTPEQRYANLADRVLRILDGEIVDDKPNLPKLP